MSPSLVHGGGVKPNAQSIKSAKYEGEFRARMAMFDLDDPLSADADAFGQSSLIELELLASVTDDSAEISRCTHKHGKVRKMLSFANINICRRSMTIGKVNVRRQLQMYAIVDI
jgi:hypothetical protein